MMDREIAEYRQENEQPGKERRAIFWSRAVAEF